MSISYVTREQRPDLFNTVRPEFTLAVVCDCGWASIANDLRDAELTAKIHNGFCPLEEGADHEQV